MEPSHLLRNSLSASLLVNEFRFKEGGMPFLPHQRGWEKELLYILQVHIVILILKDGRSVKQEGGADSRKVCTIAHAHWTNILDTIYVALNFDIARL